MDKISLEFTLLFYLLFKIINIDLNLNKNNFILRL